MFIVDNYYYIYYIFNIKTIMENWQWQMKALARFLKTGI